MRILRLLVVAMLAVLLMMNPLAARAFDIPAFTPNVVDPNDLLDDADTGMVNAELLRIRAESGIWGAVFIVDTLGDEAIESVAVEAFQQWQLGQKDVDNGLLLVLAMTDRKSRFEVGYGLEGSITDVAARHALDNWLAPRMRQGDPAGAIVDAFGFLSRIVAQDPEAARELLAAETTAEDDFDWNRGLTGWAALVFALWATLPIRNRWVARQRARLQRREPMLSLDREGILGNERAAAASSSGNVLIKSFLTINPGVFVVMLAGWFVEGLIATVAVVGLVMLLVIYLPGRRYASPERYRRHLDALDRQRKRLIDAGHVEETAPGVYAYTPAYHASRAAAASSSSGFSSSSSSSSSSSGGGRSGGGGASSGW